MYAFNNGQAYKTQVIDRLVTSSLVICARFLLVFFYRFTNKLPMLNARLVECGSW